MPSSSTITTIYNFSAGTKARAEEVNANFDLFRGILIPVDPTAQSSVNDLSYGMGSAEHRWGESYIEKINFGRTTSSWLVGDETNSSNDFVFSQGGTEKFRVYRSHDMTVESTQHLSFLINGYLSVVNSEDGPRGITHNSTVRYARYVLQDGGATNGVTTIRVNVSGVSTTAFNLTGTGAGNVLNGTVTLTAFSVTSSDYITIDVTAVNNSNNLHLKLY